MELTKLIFDLTFVTVVTAMVLAPHALQTFLAIRERKEISEPRK
jgi:hypothetical protein